MRLHLGVQPRRGDAVVRESRRDRSGLRDVLLGRRAHRRPELQPADDGRAARQGRLGRAPAGAAADAPRTTPVEQALIAALGEAVRGTAAARSIEQRTGRHGVRRAPCGTSRRQFPDDMDVQVLFAEALMNANPWKLWTPDGIGLAGHAGDRGDARARARGRADASGRESLLRPHDGGLAPSGEGAGFRDPPHRHDARRGPPPAHARAHPAARRPLQRCVESEPRRHRRRQRVPRGDDAARLLRDVRRAQLSVPRRTRQPWKAARRTPSRRHDRCRN